MLLRDFSLGRYRNSSVISFKPKSVITAMIYQTETSAKLSGKNSFAVMARHKSKKPISIRKRKNVFVICMHTFLSRTIFGV